MSRRKQIAIDDCGKCKMDLGELQRQSLGCGYLPRTDRVHLNVWQPPRSADGKHGWSGPDLTVCAGYTANLPEVIEAHLARAHWSKGNVPMDSTPEALLGFILIIDGQHNAMDAWRMAEKSE